MLYLSFRFFFFFIISAELLSNKTQSMAYVFYINDSGPFFKLMFPMTQKIKYGFLTRQQIFYEMQWCGQGLFKVFDGIYSFRRYHIHYCIVIRCMYRCWGEAALPKTKVLERVYFITKHVYLEMRNVCTIKKFLIFLSFTLNSCKFQIYREIVYKGKRKNVFRRNV